MHKTLDKIADELEERSMVNEAIEISKATKIKDFNILSEAIDDSDDENKEEIKPEELTDAQLEYIAKNIKRVTDELGASTVLRRIKKDVIAEDDIPVHVIDIALKLYQLTLQRDLEVSETTVGDQEIFKNSFKEGYVLGHNFYAKLSPAIKGNDKKLTQSIGRQIDRYMQHTLYKDVTDMKQMESILATFNIQAFILGVENAIGTLEDLEKSAQIELTPEEEVSADEFLATPDKDLNVPGIDIPVASEDQSRTQERQVSRMLADDKYSALEELAPKSLVAAVKEVDLFIYNIIKNLQTEDAAVSLGRRIEGNDGAFVALDDKDAKLFPLHIQYQIPRFSLMFRTSRDILIALMKKNEGSGEDKTRVIDNPESSKQFIFEELKNLIIDKAYSFPENKGMVNKMNQLAGAAKKEMLADSEESISLLDTDYEKFKKQAEETDDQKLKLSLVNKSRQAKQMSDQLASNSFKLFSQELDGVTLTEYILENFADKYYISALNTSPTRNPETGQIDKDKFFNRIVGRMFGSFKFSQLGINALNSIFAKHGVLRKDSKNSFNPYVLFRTNTLNRLIDPVIIKDVQKAFKCFLGYEVEADEEGDSVEFGVAGLKSFKSALESIKTDASPYTYASESKEYPGKIFILEDRNKKYSDKILTSKEELAQRIDKYFDEVILAGSIKYLNISKEKKERFRNLMSDEEIQEKINKRSRKHYQNFSLYLNQKSNSGSTQAFKAGPMRKINLLKLANQGFPEYLEMTDSITQVALTIINRNIDDLIEKAASANKPAEITGKGFVKVAASKDVAEILRAGKTDIAKIHQLSRYKDSDDQEHVDFQAIDLIDELHNLSYTPGGLLVRELVGEITDMANETFQKEILSDIGNFLIKKAKELNKNRPDNDKYNLQEKESLSVAEYFVGMKGFPDERTFELANQLGRNKRNIWKEIFGITQYKDFKDNLERPIVLDVIQPSVIDFMLKITRDFDNLIIKDVDRQQKIKDVQDKSKNLSKEEKIVQKIKLIIDPDHDFNELDEEDPAISRLMSIFYKKIDGKWNEDTDNMWYNFIRRNYEIINDTIREHIFAKEAPIIKRMKLLKKPEAEIKKKKSEISGKIKSLLLTGQESNDDEKINVYLTDSKLNPKLLLFSALDMPKNITSVLKFVEDIEKTLFRSSLIESEGMYTEIAAGFLVDLIRNKDTLHKQIGKVIAEYQNYKAAESEYEDSPMSKLDRTQIPDFLAEIKRLRAKISKRK